MKRRPVPLVSPPLEAGAGRAPSTLPLWLAGRGLRTPVPSPHRHPFLTRSLEGGLK
jgi:hypothetical protein